MWNLALSKKNAAQKGVPVPIKTMVPGVGVEPTRPLRDRGF